MPGGILVPASFVLNQQDHSKGLTSGQTSLSMSMMMQRTEL